jgi:hypothetical protein
MEARMAEDTRLDQVLHKVNPERRGTLKKIIAGAAFVVPTVASFAVADLAYGSVGSGVTTTTVIDSTTITATTIVTLVQTVTVTSCDIG